MPLYFRQHAVILNGMGTLRSSESDRFTREQLVELRASFDRAEALKALPRLPEWYRNLPVPERGLALVLSKYLGRA